MVDPVEFLFTKLIKNVSMVSGISDSESKSVSFQMKDKLNGLSERWYEELNDCTNPSINQVIKGLRHYLVEHMLNIGDEKPDDELEKLHILYQTVFEDMASSSGLFLSENPIPHCFEQ